MPATTTTTTNAETARNDTTARTQQASNTETEQHNDLENVSVNANNINTRKKRARILSQDMLSQRIRAQRSIDVAALDSLCVWSVSSAKHGNGVSNLLHINDLSTFWQSDGNLPHIVHIQFVQLTAIDTVCVYLDFTKDESYTPRVIKVKAGTFDGDMTEVASAEVEQPTGWVMLELNEETNMNTSTSCEKLIQLLTTHKEIENTTNKQSSKLTLSAWLSRIDEETVQRAFAADQHIWATQLEILFTENHHNGRDCHVRGIRILSANQSKPFTNSTLSQHMTIRESPKHYK